MDPIKFNKQLQVWKPTAQQAQELLQRLEKELALHVRIQNTIAQLKKNIGIT